MRVEAPDHSARPGRKRSAVQRRPGSRPPKAGPMLRTVLYPTDISVTAAGMSRLSRISPTEACHAGSVSAKPQRQETQSEYQPRMDKSVQFGKCVRLHLTLANRTREMRVPVEAVTSRTMNHRDQTVRPRRQQNLRRSRRHPRNPSSFSNAAHSRPPRPGLGSRVLK